MSDSFSVVSSQGWGSRIFESIKSVLFGGVLFLVAFPVLFWNEGRAVRTAKSLTEGLGAVVPVGAESIDASKEGKLVHVAGPVKTTPIADDELPVHADAVKLIRNVDMYQWTEHEKSETRKKVGGGSETVKTYTYTKEWAPGRVNSFEFQKTEGHENPPAPKYSSKTFTADPVKVGAFTMSPEQVEKLTDAVDHKVDAANAPAYMKISDGKFFIADDPASPKVGDVRIAYQEVKPAAVSLVAVQKASTFTPFQAKAGDTILLVESGMHTAAEMFKTAQDRNAVLSWILRAVGFFMMFLGIFLVFKPLAVLADVLPMFGTFLSAGIGLFAFLGAAVLTVTTIAIAWLVVRPILGIALLAAAIAGVWWLVKVGRGKRAARAGAAQAAASPAMPNVI